MIQREFVRKLVRAGCYMQRHGKLHDLYVNPRTGKRSAVPRHPVIRESLCELILKQLGLK